MSEHYEDESWLSASDAELREYLVNADQALWATVLSPRASGFELWSTRRNQ